MTRSFFQRRRHPIRSEPGANITSTTTADAATFLQQSQTLIPAEIRMISGCEDEQTSADLYNAHCSNSGLPPAKGRAGGACTSALLDVLQQTTRSSELTFQQVLMQLRQKLQQQGHSQIPQLTSSRPLDLDETPFLLGSCHGGVNRALLIGINYKGQHPGELRGCHNDVLRMQQYLEENHGFSREETLILMDDNDSTHHAPSRQTIIKALQHLVQVSQPGDAIFVHYSGHGGLLEPLLPQQQQQQKEFDQTWIPLDHHRSGHIRDFNLFHQFVQPLPAGVVCTCLLDCCHSGSCLNLPYDYLPTKTSRGQYQMQHNMHFMSHLAFLYIMLGGDLPFGIFDNVTNFLSERLDGNLEDYQGTLTDVVDHDTMMMNGNDGDYNYDAIGNNLTDMGDYDLTDNIAYDAAAVDTVDPAAYGDTAAGYGDANLGETPDFGGVDNAGGIDNLAPAVVAGDDVMPRADYFGDTNDYATTSDYAGASGMGDNSFFTGGGEGFGGGGFEDVSGEGCGDEGCGDGDGCLDLLSTIADVLNDQ